MQVPRYFKVAVQEGDYGDGLIDMRTGSNDPSLGLSVDDRGPTFDPVQHKAHSVSPSACLSFAYRSEHGGDKGRPLRKRCDRLVDVA